MQHKQLLVACTLLASLSFHAWGQKISGQVLDVNGKGINGAKISANLAVNNKSTLVTTDESGAFTLTNVNPGLITLTVTANSYTDMQQGMQLSEQDLTNVKLMLSPASIEVIKVHASPFNSSTISSALPVNVLSSDELRAKQASTLGETLKNEVGVHSSYFGPVASSPIIRGMDGPRVMITQNGLDVGDASRVGPDHVVASETTTATQIEVLRGPATLFYGSGAIGGVVNVVDNRVPTSTDTSAEWLLQHNDVADENQASLSLDSGSNNIALHLDGFWRESGDYKIAGNSELEDDEHGHEAESSGTLANSASKSSGFTFGSSYLFENGYIGASYGRMTRTYGVPGHAHEEHEDDHGEEDHDHEAGHEDEQVAAPDVYADMEQNRFQLLSELNFKQFFIKRLQAKLAYTDYQHQEIEGGEVGTQFDNESLEGRLDLYHQYFNGWQGAWTLHYKESKFSAVGEEAFTPSSTTKTRAFAWLEEQRFDEVLVQFGARIEHLSIVAQDLAYDQGHSHEEDEHINGQQIFSFKKQTFTPISASAGLVWDFTAGYNLGLSFAYSQRAPSAGELFSFGPHIGTNTFEVGALFALEDEGDGQFHVDLSNKEADLESSYNLDITLRKFQGDFGFVFSTFYNHIADYYYQQATGFTFSEDHGHEDEALPVLVYRQDDVDMYGAEIELVYQWSDSVKTSVFADMVRAKLTDGGNLPRIPPKRIGSQFNYQGQSFDSELSASYYFSQHDTSINESSTSGYLMLDAHLNYYLSGFGSDTVLYLKGQNLSNENARVHSSFLKNIAPVPGRGLTIGIRGSF